MTNEIELEPVESAIVFGENVGQARKYAELLVRDADLLGLLGPRELPKLWSRHILNSAVVSELVQNGENVADIGSGAGLPGIPMAIAKPNATFTLIEPMERRADWLISTVGELGLTNVKVRRARAEEVHDEVFDVVTARALAALPKLLRLAVPLARHGGRVLSLKGQKASEEMQEAQRIYKKLGIQGSQIQYCGEAIVPEPTLVVETQLL